MILTLQEQLRVLVQIQEIDLKVDQINKAKSTPPQELVKADESLKKAQQQIRTLQAQNTELDKSYRQVVSAMELNRDRTQRTQGRMEQVGNTKEFQAATKEMDQLKKVDQSLEEQKVKLQLEVEKFKSDLAKLQEQESALQAERDRVQSGFAGQIAGFETSLGELGQSKKSIVGKIDAPLVTRYDRVRGAKNGLGIVPAVAGRCMGCNMTISPQQVNELHRLRELQCCSNCHRILFLPESSPSSATELASAEERS